MTYIEKSGNLFNTDAPALAHGVNTHGKMGAGIAKMFRMKFPSMYRDYETRCKAGLEPGTLHVWQDSQTGLWIYNLATQDRPGKFARYDWIERSVHLAILHASENGINRIAMPRIGSGIGGLEWDRVKTSLEQLALGNPTVDLEIWTL